MPSGTSRSISGHVDVEVIGPDNVLLAIQHVPYSQWDSRRRAMIRQATFLAKFPAVPSQGVVIVLRHHPAAREGREEGTS
jgi:hypothetical protein